MLQPQRYYFSIVRMPGNTKAVTPYLCLYVVLLFLIPCFGAGCSSTTPLENASPVQPSPVVWTPPSVQTEQSLIELIRLEREAAHLGNWALLAELWISDGRVVDGRGTTTTVDDYIWQGRSAILDRYRIAVAPNPPPLLTDAEAHTYHVQFERVAAIAQNNQDQWRFLYAEGRWWLAELIYNYTAVDLKPGVFQLN